MRLTVWTGLWGSKYPELYLHRLRHAVRRNLAIPHRFRVLSDKRRLGYVTKRPPMPWVSWWPKLALFAIDSPGDVNLWIDIDSVIVGPLDVMVARHQAHRLSMPSNWAQSGHGGCQSSVMIWRSGECLELFADFDFARDSTRLWGDQEWITERWGNPGQGRVSQIGHPAVVSYKYHCRELGQPPPGACVVTMHGEPKPAALTEPWVRACWH